VPAHRAVYDAQCTAALLRSIDQAVLESDETKIKQLISTVEREKRIAASVLRSLPTRHNYQTDALADENLMNIACPGCGRTMYDLQGTLARIKAATGHLKGLKIGVMGCIVNGPGEMADADYGYVGAARGKVSLYRKQVCVEKNIPEEEAIEHLLKLIESDRTKE
jgi:4-hydroxy-3-methylbut-2-en-1-yl diphosphate synthase IspG/GcpE